MKLKYLTLAAKSFVACGYSAWTYIFNGMPADKPSYFANTFGFEDTAPNLVESIATYRADPSYHHLKDVLVEWTKVWPQRAAKLLALAGILLTVLTALLFGTALTLIVFF